MKHHWLAFIAKVFVILVAFALASPVILPIYASLQIGPLKPFIAAPLHMQLQPDGGIYVYWQNYPQPAVQLEATSFNGLGLLLALFLAGPRPWKPRLLRSCAALAILLLFLLSGRCSI